MKVGILGGSFDPPHLGHQLLAVCALALEDIDELWVIPCADHPFAKKLSSFDHRIQMCRLAFSAMDKRVKIVDIERSLPGPSYTVKTLDAIRKKQPDLSLTFIMGSDVFLDLPKWREPERLAQLSQLSVFLRQGAGKIDLSQTPYQAKVHSEFVLPHVKSTLIRDSLRSGVSKPPFVDRRVLAYVNEQKLYTVMPA
jgi:nicotinate-nucleotide adenylyltransferase